MDPMLYVSIVLLINSIIFYKISKMQPKIKYRVLKKIKMNYLNLLYGKKAEFDKKTMPILFGLMIFGLIVFNILIYVVYGDSISISSIIAEIFIIISMIVIWISMNNEIDVFIGEDGIYYQNKFISWNKIKEIKKENGFIKFIGKGKIFSQRMFLKDDGELENIIKNQIEKFRNGNLY
ncbi:hypothetical protein [Methanotorris formicicus]|nr:hypothetical protein [Methanotorris formicicus]